MSAVYDNWERLVGATLKREQLRQLALINSTESSFNSLPSDCSFNSPIHSVSASVIPSSSSYSAASSTQYYPIDTGKGRVENHTGGQSIAFKELRRATKNFRYDLFLGGGRFGYVFKGWIDEKSLSGARPGSGMPVAVKKWYSRGAQGHREYLTEVLLSSLLSHPNVVKLVGYCAEENERLLVYEFMPNGSLDNHLFVGHNRALSWDKRINVAIGVARGLCFLHGREPQVIHRDVKASNIFLDVDFNAKLSGFTSAKLSSTGGRTMHAKVKGTDGYIAPEHIMTGESTLKCDVYSFGVVLLELLCGRSAVDPQKVGRERYLVDWANTYLWKLLEIIDTKLEGQYPEKGAYTVAILAWQCVNPDPKLRPCITKALAALEQLKTPTI